MLLTQPTTHPSQMSGPDHPSQPSGGACGIPSLVSRSVRIRSQFFSHFRVTGDQDELDGVFHVSGLPLGIALLGNMILMPLYMSMMFLDNFVKADQPSTLQDFLLKWVSDFAGDFAFHCIV